MIYEMSLNEKNEVMAMRTKLEGLGTKLAELESLVYFYQRVVLTNERDFEVVYIPETKKFALATTFSNQDLSEDYLRLLMTISNIINGKEEVQFTSKYGVGTSHMTTKGQIQITRTFVENNVEMIEYRLGTDLYVNKKVNLVSNIHKFAKRSN